MISTETVHSAEPALVEMQLEWRELERIRRAVPVEQSTTTEERVTMVVRSKSRKTTGSSSIWLPAVAISVLAIGVFAGCGGDDSSNGSDDSPSSSSAGTDIEPRTIGVVDIIRQSPIDNAIDEAMESAGEQIGWDVDVADAGGDPAEANRALQAFVTERVDAIILVSIDANAARVPIQAANDADIPVIEIGAEVEESDLWSAQYGEDEVQLTASLAEHIFSVDPAAKIGDLTVTAILNGITRKDALEAAVAEQGEAEIVASTSVDLADPVGSTQQAVSSMLQADPDIDAIHAVYDNFLQAALQTVTNRRSDAKVYSYFTAPETVEALQTDTPLEAVADTDLATTGMIAFDQLISHFENDTEIDRDAAEKHPLEYVIVTRDNVDEMLKGKDAVFPTEEIIGPWIEKWESEYGG